MVLAVFEKNDLKEYFSQSETSKYLMQHFRLQKEPMDSNFVNIEISYESHQGQGQLATIFLKWFVFEPQ